MHGAVRNDSPGTAYAAAVVAFAFAAVSLYCGLGGTGGLGTLGGRIEELARAYDPVLVAVTWVSVVLKVLGGLLASPWCSDGGGWRRAGCSWSPVPVGLLC